MPCGILVIDKPRDWTSMDVCAKVRRVLGERRVGHAGTLDPMATGVLTVFVGRATRAAEFAEAGQKTYEALLRLGTETDTQDITGTVLRTSQEWPNRAALEAVLPRFRGEIQQIPPMYSALKRGGKKLYELARQGKSVEREPRTITISALELGERHSNTDWSLRVACSKGTYIRTLCHDIGHALGCGGTMAALRRTAASGYTLDDAMTLEELLRAVEEGRAEALLRPVDSLFGEYPALKLWGRAEQLCRNGNPFRLSGEDGTYRFYAADGSFLMLGRRESGLVRTIKSFF